MREPADHYLPTLDGWRAFAISMVLASHALTVGPVQTGGLLNRLTFRLGTFGVMLFFAISGFLICTRLLTQKETARLSLRSFYIRRVFRILPAAYVYLVVVGCLALAGVIATGRTDLAVAALFAGNYLVTPSWFTGHFWSLALEEHFYLFWPPLAVCFSRGRLMAIAAGLAILSIVLRCFVLRGGAGELPGYTHLRLDAFMFPCMLAILLRDPRVKEWFQVGMTPLVWCSAFVVLGIGVALGVRFPGWREPQRVLQSALLPVFIATTVLRPDDPFARFLRLPGLEWLGRKSYSVYLWQQLVFGLAPRSGLWRIVSAPWLIAMVLGIAFVSRNWIELPMIVLARRMTRINSHRPDLNPGSPPDRSPIIPR